MAMSAAGRVPDQAGWADRAAGGSVRPGPGRRGSRPSPSSCRVRSRTAGGNHAWGVGAGSNSQVSSSSRPGRSPGSLARQAAITSRSVSSGTSARSGSACTMLLSTAHGCPSPNAPRPVAAKVRTEPRASTSAGGPCSRASTCSGDMNDGVPSTTLGLVSEAISRARAMPKSMTRGPSEAMMMLLGFRSRCTTPNAWMAKPEVARARVRPSAATGRPRTRSPATAGCRRDRRRRPAW